MPLTDDRDRRKRNLIIIGVILVLMVVATVAEVGIRAPQLPIANNLIVFALLNLNIIVFLLLLVLLFRNLVKLYFERRQKLLGSKFKAKLVLALLALALVPSIVIFLIASNFINTSIEGWFKVQVERPLDQALDVAQTYYQALQDTALRHSQAISRTITREQLLTEDRRERLVSYLEEQKEQFSLSVIAVFSARGNELAHVKTPELASLPSQPIELQPLTKGLEGETTATVRDLGNADLVQAVTPIWSPEPDRRVIGAVGVSLYVPQRLEARVRGISQAFKEYKQLKLLKNPIKGIYILLFLLMTLIIVFSVTWFGLYLARGITVPIQLLAEGTREVAAGNLSYKVEVRADDEIGILVNSFNRMTGDLAQSKTKLEEAYPDLQKKHVELEERRRYTETILEAVATGVISLDPSGRLTTVNRAAARMLGLTPEAGQPAQKVFVGPEFLELATLIQRMDRLREGTLDREIRLRRDGHQTTLLGSATALRGPHGEYAGMVLVFDDLTELLKAQRLAAWREVAQRIAHEIKNPLTPIQLSAERLRRRLADRLSGERGLVEECTRTIIEEVEGLRQLVDEFSRFARMPTITLRPTELNRLLEGVARLYAEAQPAVTVTAQFSPDLPIAEVDPDQIKRAVLNLVENAVEAVHGSGAVSIETVWLPDAHRARIIVSDTGVGISTEDKEKLFLPYFSTKATGMGLGLPIVNQIVTDHGGAIWVEDNHPKGSRFVIELPIERAHAAVKA